MTMCRRRVCLRSVVRIVYLKRIEPTKGTVLKTVLTMYNIGNEF